MKTINKLIIGLVVLASTQAKLLRSSYTQAQINLFDNWLVKNDLVMNSGEDYEYRLSVFTKNKEMIDNHNRTNGDYTMAVNHFAALTDEEFAKQYLMEPRMSGSTIDVRETMKSVKEFTGKRSMNWVKEGKVNKIQDQQNCGSCYSFAATAAMESYYAIHVDPNQLPKFSEQFMVDCGKETELRLMGCKGGVIEDTMKFSEIFGAVLSDDYRSYSATADKCRWPSEPFTRLKAYRHVFPTVENLFEVLETNPAIVGVELTPSMRFYKSGVMRNKAPCGIFINHAVLAVGYDLDAEIPYFLIRNSFGEIWGDNGYYKIEIGVLGTSGTCAIVSENSWAPSV